MSIDVTCRRCQHEFDAPDRLAGEEMDCPSCGAVLTVPRGGGRMRQPEDRSRSAPARRQREDEDDRPQRRRAVAADDQPGTGVQLGLGIAGLVLGIFSALFALIPCLGMFSLPFSSLALLMALIGLIVAFLRKGHGIGFPIAGSLVGLLAIGIGVANVYWMKTVRDDAAEFAKQAQAKAELDAKQRKMRQEEMEKEKYKPGKPLAQAWENDVAYLSELDEFEVVAAPGKRLGKRGMLGSKGPFDEPEREMKVGGQGDPHGLCINPPAKGVGSVKYRLGGAAQRLEGGVALNDAENAFDQPREEVTFEILGDGKGLWKSKPTKTPGHKQVFELDVSGVKEIELRVHYPGIDVNHVHALWLQARVSRAREGEKKDKDKKEEKDGNTERLPPPEIEKAGDGGDDGKGGEVLPPPLIEKVK